LRLQMMQAVQHKYECEKSNQVFHAGILLGLKAIQVLMVGDP
jgi:hypothetical protein